MLNVWGVRFCKDGMTLRIKHLQNMWQNFQSKTTVGRVGHGTRSKTHKNRDLDVTMS